MRRFIPDLPRNVAIAFATLAASLVLIALSVVFLGGARDAAIAENGRLTNEVQAVRGSINTARQDHEYVVANQEKYEVLLKSDRLIPHTRRAAVVELQRIAQMRGLTTLNYEFAGVVSDSLESKQAQPANAAYRLSVEQVTLTVGAVIDGAIYGLVSDISEKFPGAAVVENVTLARAPVVTEEALLAVAAGAEAKLVEGKILFLWRTAQANEPAANGAK